MHMKLGPLIYVEKKMISHDFEALVGIFSNLRTRIVLMGSYFANLKHYFLTFQYFS